MRPGFENRDILLPQEIDRRWAKFPWPYTCRPETPTTPWKQSTVGIAGNGSIYLKIPERDSNLQI